MNPTTELLERARDLRDTVHAGSLEVDRAPVTNARYARFVEATGHRAPFFWPNGECPPRLRNHPVVGVDFFDALAFARWAGGALPTELQWVQATGLGEHRAYPWGDEFHPDRCNTVRSELKCTSPVGSHPGGTAPSGCVDMCGNVWELTCSPHPDDALSVLVKGGSWYDYPVHAKIDASFRAGLNRCLVTVGFRLVYGVEQRFPPALADAGLVEESIAFRRAARHAAHRDAGHAGPPTATRLPPALAVAMSPAEALAVLDVDEPAAPPAPRHAPTERTLRHKVTTVVAALRLRQAAHEAFRRVRAAGAAFRASRTESWRIRIREALAELRLAQAVRSAWERGRAAADAWRTTPTPLVFERVRAYACRPRSIAVVLAACGLLVLLVALSTGVGSSERPAPRSESADARAGSALIADGAPSHRLAAGAAAAEPAASGAPGVDRGPRDAIDQALGNLASDRGRQRDAAEQFLIRHGDASYDRVRDAFRKSSTSGVRASLRYVLAALDEERAAPVAPVPSTSPPDGGLVVFIDELDAGAAGLVARVRRTARAEQLGFTVVVVGDEDLHTTLARHGHVIGDAEVYADTGGRLAQARGFTQLPVVAAHRADGRIAFVLHGAVPRHLLALGVARLKP